MNLNENETKVLKSLANQMNECTGGEFGYIVDADRCGFTKHEFAGYVGSLVKKEMFEYFIDNSKDDGVDCNEVQFALKQEIYTQFVS